MSLILIIKMEIIKMRKMKSKMLKLMPLILIIKKIKIIYQNLRLKPLLILKILAQF